MARFGGYTLRTLLDEDAELVTVLNLEAEDRAEQAAAAAFEAILAQQQPW